MKKCQEVILQEENLEDTLSLNLLNGTRVISKNGLVIGKVSEVLVDPKKLEFEGILISRGLSEEGIYIGKSYIENLSPEGISLKIDPSPLLKGRRVINTDGKKIGTVKEVARRGDTNSIQSITISSFFKKDVTISPNDIEEIGKTIIVKKSYNGAKKHFWQKS